jgi:uncharacterized protein (DUF1330 family)
MTAYNVVRFRVRPGMEEQFLDYHRKLRPELKGFLGGSMIGTGGQSFCLVGEWKNFKSIVDARPQMHTMLDAVRDMLEDLGGGLGLTDPVSGEVAVRLTPAKAAKAAKAARPAKTASAAKRSKASKARAKPAKTRAKTKAKPATSKRRARKAQAGKRATAKKR